MFLELTKGVDSPNDTLRKDLMLVQRDQSAQSTGSQLGEDDTVARSISLKHL